MAEGAVVGGLGPGLVLVSLAVVVRGALARELTSPGGLQQRYVDIVDTVDTVDTVDICRPDSVAGQRRLRSGRRCSGTGCCRGCRALQGGAAAAAAAGAGAAR